MEYEILRKDVVISLEVDERELRILAGAVGSFTMDQASRAKPTKDKNIHMNRDLGPMYSKLMTIVSELEK